MMISNGCGTYVGHYPTIFFAAPRKTMKSYCQDSRCFSWYSNHVLP